MRFFAGVARFRVPRSSSQQQGRVKQWQLQWRLELVLTGKRHRESLRREGERGREIQVESKEEIEEWLACPANLNNLLEERMSFIGRTPL